MKQAYTGGAIFKLSGREAARRVCYTPASGLATLEQRATHIPG